MHTQYKQKYSICIDVLDVPMYCRKWNPLNPNCNTWIAKASLLRMHALDGTLCNAFGKIYLSDRREIHGSCVPKRRVQTIHRYFQKNDTFLRVFLTKIACYSCLNTRWNVSIISIAMSSWHVSFSEEKFSKFGAGSCSLSM